MGLVRAERRQGLDEEDRRWRFKLGLRSVATFLAVPAMILFAASTGMSTHYYGGDDWVDGMPLAPVCQPCALLVLLRPRFVPKMDQVSQDTHPSRSAISPCSNNC